MVAFLCPPVFPLTTQEPVIGITKVDSIADPADSTTYTFADANLGDAAPNRVIVVAVTSRASGSRPITGVTVGGITAHAIVNDRNAASGNSTNAAIYAAEVPAGATGDIVVTHANQQLRCAITVYRVVVSAYVWVEGQSGFSADNNPSVSLDIPAGGGAIAISYTQANTTASWVGLSEDTDASAEGTSAQYSSAHAEFSTVQTGHTIQCNWGSNSLPAMAAAVFRPAKTPVVRDTITGASGAVSSWNAPLPLNIQSGETLLLFVTMAGNAARTITTPAGWEELYNVVGDNQLRRVLCYWRVADGNEGSAVTLSASGATYFTSNSYRVYNVVGNPQVGTVATGISDAPDANITTPTWGVAHNALWITAMHAHNVASAPTIPANYTNGVSVWNGSGTNFGHMSTARRELTAASEDAGAWTLPDSREWAAATVAIRS